MAFKLITAKEFLDAELAKYETWKDFSSGDFTRTNLGINVEIDLLDVTEVLTD